MRAVEESPTNVTEPLWLLLPSAKEKASSNASLLKRKGTIYLKVQNNGVILFLRPKVP